MCSECVRKLEGRGGGSLLEKWDFYSHVGEGKAMLSILNINPHPVADPEGFLRFLLKHPFYLAAGRS